MSIYKVKIIKEKKELLVLEANDELCYDNYLWNKLGKVVELVENNSLDQSNLLKLIKEKTGFSKSKSNDNVDVTFDFDSRTVDKPYFPIYSFDEVEGNCPFKLIKTNNKFFASYEDGSEYELKHVHFENIDLFKKEVVTIDEFREIVKFVTEIIKEDDTDFILNDTYVIRFNNA